MIFRMLLGRAMVLPFCLALSVIAQPVDARADMKDRVLDLLFPLDTGDNTFLTKMTLRFGDSDTQLVVSTYLVYPVHPGGPAELFSYSIEGMGNENLSQFISKMVAQNPKVTDREIAAMLKVKVSRSPIGDKELDHFLNELKAIRISPILASRIFCDAASEYEFWYDGGGQETVHYTVFGPSKGVVGPWKGIPQDKLVQWMIRFRASVPDLLKAGSSPKP